jgi:hypothetical protein
MNSSGPEGDDKLRQSLDDPARLKDEQIRLQSVMIEMLNVQLRGCRDRIDRQTERILELKRLIRVRDDLIYLQGSAPRSSDAGNGTLWRRLTGWWPGSRRP